MKSIHRFLAFGLITCLIQIALGDGPNPPLPLVLSIRLAEPAKNIRKQGGEGTFPYGAPIKVDCLLKNTGANSLELKPWYKGAEGIGAVLVHKDSGKRVASGWAPPTRPRRMVPLEIPPGKSVSFQCDISFVFHPPFAMWHNMFADVVLFAPKQKYELFFDYRRLRGKEKGKSYVPLALRSNKVSFEVTEPSDRPGNLSRGQRMRRESALCFAQAQTAIKSKDAESLRKLLSSDVRAVRSTALAVCGRAGLPAKEDWIRKELLIPTEVETNLRLLARAAAFLIAVGEDEIVQVVKDTDWGTGYEILLLLTTINKYPRAAYLPVVDHWLQEKAVPKYMTGQLEMTKSNIEKLVAQGAK